MISPVAPMSMFAGAGNQIRNGGELSFATTVLGPTPLSSKLLMSYDFFVCGSGLFSAFFPAL